MPNNYSYRKQISSCLGREWRKIELSRDRKKLLELGKLRILNMVISQVNTFYQSLTNCTPKYVQYVNYTSTVEYLRVLKSLVLFKTNPFLIPLDFLLKLH